MVWWIEFLPKATKELRKLDRTTASRIVKTLEERIAVLDDPRALGSGLRGDHSGVWRWRIGDHRVVARIEDERITVLVVRIDGRFAVKSFAGILPNYKSPRASSADRPTSSTRSRDCYSFNTNTSFHGSTQGSSEARPAFRMSRATPFSIIASIPS